MPGFWGQYGPKIRDASFLGPLHFTYDHFDHKYRRGEQYRMEHLAKDVVTICYTYSRQGDTPRPTSGQIIPFYYLRKGQTILSIIGNRLSGGNYPAVSFGIYLFSEDFKKVLAYDLNFPTITSNAVRYEVPYKLHTKTVMDIGHKNYQDYLESQDLPSNWHYVDLNKVVPPFISDTVERPIAPEGGLYVCFCTGNHFMGAETDFRLIMSVATNRYVS